MKPKKRQKLCYNCEGEIDLDVIVCPYCAADLREEKPEQHSANYASSTARLMNGEYEPIQALYPPSLAIEEPEEEYVEERAISSEQSFAGAVALLTLGGQLFLLSCLLFLFSQNGVLILKWDARFWLAYFLASLPLLFFGYRSLTK